MSNNYNDKNSIMTPPKLPLTYYHNLHKLQNLAKWKDKRLEYLDIPKGLIEILQDNGFTIEKILDSEPSNIAEKLGIDSYVGEIIFRETNKTITKINSDLIFFDNK